VILFKIVSIMHIHIICKYHFSCNNKIFKKYINKMNKYKLWKSNYKSFKFLKGRNKNINEKLIDFL